MGQFPDIWKFAHVFPVFKSENMKLFYNCRPIVKLILIAKLFELIVSKKILHQINPIISFSHHGFVKSRSVTTNLTGIFPRMQTDIIYIDFSKAFDEVNRKMLI